MQGVHTGGDTEVPGIQHRLYDRHSNSGASRRIQARYSARTHYACSCAACLLSAGIQSNEISEEEALTSRLKDKNGNVVCEYIHRRNFVSLRYTPKDGTVLPITVCTEEDLQEARQTAAVRHVIFGAAYCIECLAIVLVYFKKRAK